MYRAIHVTSASEVQPARPNNPGVFELKKFFNFLKSLIVGMKYWLRIGGIFTLISHAVKFIISPIFRFDDYYMVRYDISDYRLTIMPNGNPPNIKVKVVRSKQDINDLIKEGYDIKSYATKAQFMGNYEKQIEAGGILFCACLGNEPVHTRWVAMTETAKHLMDRTPLFIDFTLEVYVGGAFTDPKSRGMGLHPYMLRFAFAYCAKMGVKAVKAIVKKDNQPSLSTVKKCGGNIYGETSELKLLFWRSSKTKIYGIDYVER